MDIEIAVNTLPFWSRFILPFDLRWNGTDCIRRIITQGTKIPVFDYRQGESAATALNGAQATERDTILTKAGQTRGGARYTILGMSITKDGMPYTNEAANGLSHGVYPPMSTQPCNGDSGPLVPSVEDMRSLNNLFLEAFLQTFLIDLKIDGSKRTIEFGPTLLYPGGGGAKDSIESANGDVFVSNFMPIPEGIFWNPSGSVDSNMVVRLEAAYDLDVPTWTTPTGTANGEPVTQDNPELDYANRTAIGRNWQQGFVLNFHGREESPTSNVS